MFQVIFIEELCVSCGACLQHCEELEEMVNNSQESATLPLTMFAAVEIAAENCSGGALELCG